MRGDRDFLFPAVSAADATWRKVGNWRTEAALLARGVSAAPILAGIASAVHSLSASLTTRIELFRDVIQLGSIAVDTIKEELSPLFEAFRHWTQLLIINFSFIHVANIHALTDVVQFLTAIVAFALLYYALRKDPNAERDGLETTTFEQRSKLAVKWRYTLTLILTSLYLPASAGALKFFVLIQSTSDASDPNDPSAGTGTGTGTDGSGDEEGFLTSARTALCPLVLLVVTFGFPFTLFRIIRRAVPPPVKFDREGKPVEEDDRMFAQAVSSSRNPYTFVFSDLRRHAAILPVYTMIHKFALCLLTVAIMPFVSESHLWVPHVIFIALCVASTTVFYKVKPYHDEMANRVATINHGIVSANAVVAGLTAANLWGGGAAAFLLLLLQGASIAINSSTSLWRSEALRRKLRNAFSSARFSRNDDGDYMVLDPATDFLAEVHKRLWQPALDRLLYYGDGLALPKVSSVNEQVIKHQQGMYDASADTQPRRAAKGGGGGGGGDVEAGQAAGGDQEEGDPEDADTVPDASEDGVDAEVDEEEEEPTDGGVSSGDAGKAGQSLMDKAAAAFFRRKRRKDDPLSDCGIFYTPGCPPYLLNFRGTVGERHYENRQILERIGADSYAKELRRLSAGESSEERERSRLVWTQFSAVDMYWQPPGGARKGTGFGKAIIIPFPMCLLFQFDGGGSEVMQPPAFAHYLAGNRDTEILRRRDVRLQIRALRGEMCYFHYQEWRTKTKTRQVQETVYENGQQVQRTRTETYTVSVLFTFSNGRLRIGTISANAKWKGVNVAAGFRVTLFYSDGHGVDNEGTHWSGETATIGHDKLGITADFSMTADLKRLLGKNMGTVRSNRPGVERFWARYREFYHGNAERKKRTLSYDFLVRVYMDRSLMQFDARDRLEGGLRAEGNDAIASVPDRFNDFLSDLYSAAGRALVAGKRSAAWFTFWHDFWTMNCDLPRVRKQAELLNPIYRTSMPAMYTMYASNRTQLEQELHGAGLRSKHGNRGFFRDSVLDVLWQAMDRAEKEAGAGGGAGAGTPTAVPDVAAAQGYQEAKGEEPVPSAPAPEEPSPAATPAGYGATESDSGAAEDEQRDAAAAVAAAPPQKDADNEAARLIPA